MSSRLLQFGAVVVLILNFALSFVLPFEFRSCLTRASRVVASRCIV